MTAKEDRSDIYAWYSLIGTAGTALGFVGCGWIITFLRDEKHYDSIEAYRIIFFVYAVVGVIKLCLALMLSKACELDAKPKLIGNQETAPLLGDGAAQNKDQKRGWRLLPDISKESQTVLIQLCILFAFDNLASGLAPL